VGEIIDAAGTFFRNIADVGFTALGIGLALHLLRLASRVPAWRNIIRAAYPGTKVPWRAVFGGYFAGIGVNAVVPARGGDLLKLYLVRHRVPESRYPTLGSTLIVETLFDAGVAAGLILWALALGVLPGLDVIPNLPQVDWSWPLRHPKTTAIVVVVWGVVLVLLIVIAIRRVRLFKQRVKQGFAILRPFSAYVQGVVTWQALSWGFRLASVFFFLEAFQLPATLHNAALVLVVQSLSTLFPFTPGGVGTQQGLIAYIFRQSAPTTSIALVVSFSVGMYVATTIVNVVAGFGAIFAMLRTLRWRRVVVPEEEKAYARQP
jgi:uncharacterized membrane protein YbhN (UPF0104 family)